MRFGPSQTRPVWPPRAGHFRLRLCRGGWAVPAKIQHSPIEGWRAIIDEAEKDWHDDPAYASGVSLVWHHGMIVDVSEYDWCLAVKRWAEKEHSDHPSLHPQEPIRRMILPPFFPQRRPAND
jgi:hypothetical protein